MHEYTLLGMFYTAAQTALLACIRYWLYQDNLRVRAKRMYLLAFAISCGGTLLYAACFASRTVPFSLVRLSIAGSMFVLSCCIIKEPFFKHTYTYSFIMVYDSAIEITASFAQSRLAPGPRGAVFALTAAALVGVSFIPAVRYLKRMIERLSAAGDDKLWGWLCLISFSFVFMNLLFTYPPAHTPAPRELLSRYLMLFGLAGMYAATTRAVETMREAADAKAALDLTQKRVALQQGYYDRMLAQMDEVRRYRHDARHHRAAIAALAQSGDLQALSAYIGDMPEREEALPLTGNLTADSLLLYYMDAAKQKGVAMETELAMSADLPVSDPDLCVILGNLLENAVDAQGYLPKDARYIRVRARGGRDTLTLAVDNRFDGALAMENGAYRSRKAGGGHGLGLSSVRSVCEKYGGVLQLETDGDMFMAGVVIGV